MRKTGFRFIVILLVTSFLIPYTSVNALLLEGYKIPGWDTGYSNISPMEATAYLDDSTKCSGTYSLRITNNIALSPNRYMVVRTYVPAEKGRTYLFGMNCKAEYASGVTIMNDFQNRHSLLPLGGKYNWTPFEFEYTHNSENAVFPIEILVENATKAFWIDDVYCYEKGSKNKKNLVGNPSFEEGAAAFASKIVPKQEDKSVSKELSMLSNLQSLTSDIRNSYRFGAKDFSSLIGGFHYSAVYQAKGITIDGDLSDWQGYSPAYLPSLPSQYQIYGGGTRDLTATYKYAYDDDSFYLAIETTDDVFYSMDNENYWMGDSVQIALSKNGEYYGSEIGLVHNGETGGSGIFSGQHTKEELNKINLKTTRNGTKTIYEASIPWDLKYGKKPDKILFDILVNDNDGLGRKYCVELAPGISEGKTNTKFPVLEMSQGKKTWYAWIEGDRNIKMDENHAYNLYIINEGDKDLNFKVNLPKINVKETVIVPAKSGIRNEYTYKFGINEIKTQEIVAVIDEGLSTTVSAFNIDVSLSEAAFTDDYVLLESYKNNLKELLDKCKEKNISTDYETVSYTVLERFAEYLKGDVKDEQYDRAVYEVECLKSLYKEAKTNLEAYLSGTKTPLEVPRYVTSKMEIDGKTVTAEMSMNGKTERRPMFFVGYGHFGDARDDIPNWHNFGASAIQNEIGPNSVVFRAPVDSGKDFAGSDMNVKWVLDMLKNAEDNNVAVSLLISPHYFPEFVSSMYPETNDNGIIWDHPKVLEFFNVYLETLIPLIKDYKSLNNITISNEPYYSTASHEKTYRPLWNDFLKKQYGTIAELNRIYGAEYADFANVPMPTAFEHSVLYYDYMEFNDSTYAAWHEFLAKKIKEIAPNIPVQSKMCQYTDVRDNATAVWFLTRGTDHEKFAKFSDLNGNDGWQYVHMYGDKEDTTNLQKTFWYDLQMGISPKPIVNSEDHIIQDRNTVYIPEQAEHVLTDIWQGGIHGRAFSTIWVWARDNNSRYPSDFYGSIMHRPDCVAAVGKASLDLNRLSNEVKAIIDKKPDIAIMYSKTTRAYVPEYLNSLYNAYEKILFNGQKAEFVTEDQIAKIHNYKLLILPSVKNAKKSVLENIKKYVDNGGKVLILDESTLKYNERNQLNDEALVKEIHSKSKVVPTVINDIEITSPTVEEMRDLVYSSIIDAGIEDISLIDVETGKRVLKTEWAGAVYNGNYVVNVCNYAFGFPRKVRIEVNGKKVTGAKDLISTDNLGDEFIVKPFQPMLLTFNMEQ